MTKVMAILPDEEVAEKVTSQLSDLNIDDLDWRIIHPGDDDERLFPVFGWPLGAGDARTAGGGPLGAAVETGYSEERAMEDHGVDNSDADFYGRSVEHGGIAIVVETPSEHVNAVRNVLEKADAEQVTTQ
ncbi:MAG: hypothetical protein U0350_24315 [Caldilineaceae bacterium]